MKKHVLMSVRTPSPAVIHYYLKPLMHTLALTPFALLVYGLVANKLGFNPVEELTHQTGIWSLRFLLISLAITPLRSISKIAWLTQFRRMHGLYAFFYALCHFTVYFLWDLGLEFSLVIEDVIERPYISVGFAALCLLLPLALTSTTKMRRRMKRTWGKLHRLVYLIGLLVTLHFLWLTKADYREPLIYLSIFTFLMLFRLYPYVKKTLVR